MTSRILCATDGSEHARAAIEEAVHLAKCRGAALTFITVNVAQPAMRGPVAFSMDDAEADKVPAGGEEAARAAGVKECNGVVVKSRDPAAAVVQYAEEHGVDHIVIGTGDRSLVSRLLIGSVARDVVARAHCTVTVAR